MRVVYSDEHQGHDPRTDVQNGVPVAHVERPARAERILAALQADPSFEVQPPTEHGPAPIEAVHAAGLIRFLEASVINQNEAIPDTILHPALREDMESSSPEPADLLGRLGYWCFDTGTPLLPGTYPAARGAVDVALTAVDLVLTGDAAVYGVCRPPGHHAARTVFGGFCYFNNAAVAAEYARRHSGGPIAILDVDYHHGNGTQQIFYRRADVLYVSLHADPARAYPYYTGYPDESGAGPGLRANLNIPLPITTTDEQYLDALEPALERIVAYRPDLTIVSLGMDTYAHDPLGDFSLTTSVYAECGLRIAQACARTVVLQEGGYYLPDLGENVRQFLRGLQRVD